MKTLLHSIAVLTVSGACLVASVQGVNAEGDPSAVERYSSQDGAVNVVLDRSGPLPRLQYHGSRDYMYLEAVPATRGDIVMQNERGRTVMRLSSFGGATYFGDGDKMGVPVFKAEGTSNEQAPAVYTPQQVRSSAVKLASMVSNAIGETIEFDVDWSSDALYPEAAVSLNGAVETVAVALRDAAKNPDGRKALRGTLKRVRFEHAETVGLHTVGETLYVKYSNTAQSQPHPSLANVMSFLKTVY